MTKSLLSIDDALARFAAVLASVDSRAPLFISTPNLNFLIATQSDAAFRESVRVSDLSLADGMPVVWLARMLGVPIRQRVAGSDLFEAVRGQEIRTVKVFFFGGPDGAADVGRGDSGHVAPPPLASSRGAACASGHPGRGG